MKTQEFLLRDHREVAPGAWLPARIENIVYFSEAKNPEDHSRVQLHVRAQVEEMHVNDVDDRLFRFEPRPGAVLLDRKTGECKQTHPGGLDFLDVQLQRYFAKNPERRVQKSGWSYGWLAGLPVLLVIAGSEAWLRRHKRQPPDGSGDDDSGARAAGRGMVANPTTG